MLTIFCLVLKWFLLKTRYLCNDSKHAAMRTQHFFIFTFIILLSFPVSIIAQDHSVIVEMNEKGPTTPIPRGLVRGLARFSTTADNSTTVHSADAPAVWIDLEEKEMCVRYFNPDVRCQVIVINDNGSFQITEAVATDGVVNVYRLTDMEKPGLYTVIVQIPDKSYQGSFIYKKPTEDKL